MAYYKRNIDRQLELWHTSTNHKPLLIRGARQVGKSTAVRQLGKSFTHFLEINEETRVQLDAISTALAELQSKDSPQKPRKRIGFIQEET